MLYSTPVIALCTMSGEPKIGVTSIANAMSKPIGR